MAPKPAALALQELWSHWNTTVEHKTAPKLKDGALEFKGFYGQYAYQVTYKGETYKGTVNLGKGGGEGKGGEGTVQLTPGDAGITFAG